MSNQHNDHELDCHILQRVYYDKQVGFIGQSMYSDGQWYTTATVPDGVKLMEFQNVDSALNTARKDAASKGLTEALSMESLSLPPATSSNQNTQHTNEFRSHFQTKVRMH